MLTPDLLVLLSTSRCILFACLACSLFIASRAPRHTTWMIILGVAWSLGAASILLPGNTLLWGNQGDETFQIAFFQHVIEGHWLSDFFYHHLPPFYPPLYFWIFGSIGKLFSMTGITSGILGIIATYTLLPTLSVYTARYLGGTKRDEQIALISSAGLLLFFPTEALFVKPYEALAAILSALWLVGFVRLIQQPSRMLCVRHGILGGVIFLLYYFWFALMIPAMIMLMIYHKDKLRTSFPMFAGVGSIVTLISLPFLAPYLTALLRFGQENFQATYFFPTDIHLALPWTHVSLLGVTALLGLSYFFKKDLTPYHLACGALLASILCWHVLQLLTLAQGGMSVMLSKPFLFLGGCALLLPASAFILDLWETQQQHLSKRRFGIVAALALFPLLPNGLFLDDPKIQSQLVKNQQPQTSTYLAENIRTFVPDYAQRRWLTSGLQDLSGVISLDLYLAWNPHFSHPSAHWKTRFEALRRASELTSPEAFAKTCDELGISAILFYKGYDEQGNLFYPFFYEEDAWPQGTTSKELRFSPTLLPETTWNISHEDLEWIIFSRNAPHQSPDQSQ